MNTMATSLQHIRQRSVHRRARVLVVTAVSIAAAGFALTLISGSGSDPGDGNIAATAASPKNEISPEVDLLFKQAVIMLHAKQYEHAVTALHRVLALAPTLPEAHVNMGYTMFDLHRYTVSRDFFRSAIALRPAQANAHYGLALALAELDDRGGAAREMSEYLRLAPANDPFVAKAQAALKGWRKG
jgi:tetratricopeptide (TPR) repeat protein